MTKPKLVQEPEGVDVMATRTIVSWTKFCEWVQGKIVVSETNERRATVVYFSNGAKATFHSDFQVRFGEKTAEPPLVEIEEAS